MAPNTTPEEIESFAKAMEFSRLELIEKILGRTSDYTDAELAKLVLYSQAIKSVRESAVFLAALR